jgi:soluble lytic murein transglycosylase
MGDPAVIETARSQKGCAWLALRGVLVVALCVGPLAEAVGEATPTASAPVEATGVGAGANAAAQLRAGIEAFEEGHLQRAAALFDATVRDHPIIADHAERLQVRALLSLGQYDDVIERASAFQTNYTDFPLQGEVFQLLGDAHHAVGDLAAARSAWKQARKKTRDAETRASLDLAIAASLEASALEGEAAQRYLAVWSEMPTSPAAAAAEQALERLEASTGNSLRTPLAFATRARAFYSARSNPEALVCYDRALAGSLSRSMRRELQRERAFTLFRLRQYPEAAASFGQLGKDSDARFWRARSLARSGRIEESLREFERLSSGRFNLLAARSLFLAGTLLEDELDGSRAVASYVRVASKAPTLSLRTAARWRLGWGAYLGGRYREALEHFGMLMAANSDHLDRLSARYWRARALEKLGAGEAAEEFRAVATEYPLSYYGWRAAGRVDGSSLVREAPSRAQPARGSLTETALRRIGILIEAGLYEAARIETVILAGQARSLDDRLEIAHIATALDDFHRAQRVVVDPYSERLARGPEPGLEALWWFAWPAAYADKVAAATDGRDLDPALLNAVMREESGFRAEVVSTVGARGLTQIMPETGQRLADSMGLSGFTADDLFEPASNLMLGAHYLEQLMARFHGRTSAVVASYNAGPEAVKRWIEAQPDLEDDEWVEAIPYDQTRSYVKRVLRSQQVYRVLY